MDNMQPGQIISPRTSNDSSDPTPPPQPEGAPMPERPTPTETPQAAPAPGPEPESAIPYTPDAATAVKPEPSEWQQPQELDVTPVASSAAPLPDTLQWTGAEFVAHDKSAGWYGVLMIAGVIGSVVIYFITKDKLTSAIILMTALLFAVFAARKPREQQYGLSHNGLQIGARVYDFQTFKSFSVAEEGAVASVVFMPLKRFMPPLTIYVPPENEPIVTDYLAQYLPFEQHKADAVDNLLHRIRF